MDSLGHKLVKNSAIGAGAGAAVGLGVGIWKNAQEIEKVPTDTVTLGGYDRPIMDKVKLGTDTWISADSHSQYFNGAYNHDVVVDTPVKNMDGSIKMEHVPEQTVTDHGKAIVGSKQVPIKEPCNVSTGTTTQIGSYTETDANNNTHTYNYVDVHNYVNYDMKTVGSYTQPTVKFETGVNSAGIILTNVAMFAAIGGAIGAVATIVADKIK